MKAKKTVFVGLSGGVDSSVTALRLKKEGFTVVGVFIKVWHPDFLQCNWEQERLDAMRIAAHLDIPFLTHDAEEEYKKQVADYFIEEYKKGRTPNPDVMCNKAIKFGSFLDFACNRGADYIATGHYAALQSTNQGIQLLRGEDVNKDQSYFLWTLNQKQLAKVLLPLGSSVKSEIRKEAMKANLPTAIKKDSQGICFLGHIDIAHFLSHFTDIQNGDVLDTEGNTIGKHHGALIYTIGQRHGFVITSQKTDKKAYYVVSKDVIANTITVSDDLTDTAFDSIVHLHTTNWIANEPRSDQIVSVQTRYRQKPVSAKLIKIEHESAKLEFLERFEPYAPGQSCVLYDGALCLGGGIIADKQQI